MRLDALHAEEIKIGRNLRCSAFLRGATSTTDYDYERRSSM